MPDKKQYGPRKGINVAKADNPRANTQQLSDRLAKRVASGRMSYDDARKAQNSQDSKRMSQARKVGTQTQGSSQNTVSKRTYKDAKYKLDNNGNIKAY